MLGDLSAIAKVVVIVSSGIGMCLLCALGERVLYRMSKRYRYFIKTGK